MPATSALPCHYSGPELSNSGDAQPRPCDPDPPGAMSVTVTDLFCGAGGSSLGAELAGTRLRLLEVLES